MIILNYKEKYGEWSLILGKEISEKYNVKNLVVTADFAKSESFDLVTKEVEGLDIGLMSYVACFHTFGKLQETPWEAHEQMLNVNVLTFLKFFYHYMRVFANNDKGAIINISSLTGVSSSPYNAQYGACKAYILKLTEAVAYEAKNTGVDVEVIAGKVNKQAVKHWHCNMSSDDVAAYMGAFYEK